MCRNSTNGKKTTIRHAMPLLPKAAPMDSLLLLLLL
jgi:hypothetical protein